MCTGNRRRLERLERLAAPAVEQGPRIFIPDNGRDDPPPPAAGQLAAGRQIIVYTPDTTEAPDRQGQQ